MAESINLWTALTAAEYNTRKDIGPGPRVSSQDLIDLGRSARFDMQELSLEATDDGWLIKLFPAQGEDYCGEVAILVPKDGLLPVRVLKDEVGRIAHLHR
jgi:hypothetical protein